MIEFTYKQIGENLVKTLVQKIDGGESVVLLGPRFVGKRHVLYRLRKRLEKEAQANVILLRFCGKYNVSNGEELNNAIFKAVYRAITDAERVETSLKLKQVASTLDGFGYIDQLYEETSKPVILLVSNVDSIPQHLARHFLENIQSRVDKKKLVAVMSGEYDFRDLVHGPNSPFRCSSLIVLQGYDEPEFEKFFKQYTYTLQLTFESEVEACRHLWQWSGGNVYLLRHFFSSVMEHRANRGIPVETKVNVNDYRELPSNNAVAGAYWNQSFRHANQLIAREPDCWETLRGLIKEGVRELPSANVLPSTLELAGVAVREGGILKFASPWMETLIRNHFKELQWADLAARRRRWNEAFALYEKLSGEQRLRPTDIDDRIEVETALRVLISSLYITAASGTDDRKAPAAVVQEINDLFSKGCHLLLGFPEVSFWHSERLQEFQPISKDYHAELKQYVNSTISPLAPPPMGFFQLPQPADHPQPISLYGVAAMLESIRSDHQDLVIIGDFDEKTVISPEREYLVKELIQHYVAAHNHAVRVCRDRKRLERRNHYFKIANDILNELGRDVRDVRQIMDMASRRLQEIGFGRVMFSMIDRNEQRIKGVFDNSDIDISQKSSWPLIRQDGDQGAKQCDIQQLVAYDKLYRIVEKAREYPLTDKEIVALADMKAIAVIPILDRYGESIGTIHVERANREEVLSPGEAEELKEFGRQLAIAIEKSERVTLLESTLDKTPEPMMIINSEEKLQYLNRPAAMLLNIKAGWRDKQAEAIDSLLNEELVNFIKQALGGQHNSHLIRRIATQEFTGAWLADCIADWREYRPLWLEKKAGAWAHIQDLNYNFKVLQAFQKIAAAQNLEEAEKASLDATKLLGHKWGRLWLIDEKDPNVLIGKLCYNIDSVKVEDYFNGAEKRLPPKGADKHTWLCIDKREPVLLCYNPKLPNGSIQKTPLGVEYHVVNNPHLKDEFGKEVGDFWLDLPLFAQDVSLGKISLQCYEDLSQQNFEYLKVLSSITAEQLEATRIHDKLIDELNDSIRIEVAEKSMADMAHNIATRFGSLGFLLARYQLLEAEHPELKDINDRFSELMKSVETTVLRAKEMLSVISPTLLPVDIVGLVRNTLAGTLPDEAVRVEMETESLMIEADKHQLQTALLEIIANSRDFAPEDKPLQISIIIRPRSREGAELAEIIYQDNGPGVPEGLRVKIFDRFYSHRPGRKQGLGLGLSYVFRVISAHKGTIIENGVPGEGARFVIELPLQARQ